MKEILILYYSIITENETKITNHKNENKMAKAKKTVKKATVKKTVKEEKSTASNIIEQFAELSVDERIKLAPKLQAAANQDANYRSAGTPEAGGETSHYDDLLNEYAEDEDEDNA